MSEPQEDRLDEALDRALATYRQPPERVGFDGRILARVAERMDRARRLRRGLWFCAAATAAVILCLFCWPTRKAAIRTWPASTVKLKTNLLIAPLAPARDLELVLRHVTRRRAPRIGTVQKLAQFPSPVRMGAEERALLRLATGDPKNIPPELTHPGRPVEPIQISEIVIKPLQ